MGADIKLKSTIPKGTFIRSFGALKNKKIFSDSYSQTAFSGKNMQSLLLIEGELINYEVSNNFILYGGTTTEQVDFQVVTMVKKSICITILLNGKLNFSYDNLNFSFNAEQKKRAVIVNLTRPVSFRRMLTKNNRVSKLNIILPVDWVESRIRSSDNLSTFTTDHLSNFELDLNSDILTLAFALIKLGPPSDFMGKMQVELLTQQLLLEVFKQLSDSVYFSKKKRDPKPLANKSLFDPTLDKLITYIETHLQQDISVADLADFTAMSLSNLQHKFKRALGTTLQGYIRRRRLDIAKQQLEVGLITITEAAYNAGYRYPSNFTSAFKKTFGFPPQNIIIKSDA